MDDSRINIVLIDDGPDSDIEMLVMELNAGKTSKPEDDDCIEFPARLKRFFESCCVIDRINLDPDSDDEKKPSSKCLNPYCPSGEDIQVAPEFVKSYYGLLKFRNLQVCGRCFRESVDHFKDLSSQIKYKESIFDANFPKSNPVVLIDSDDEEEILAKDEPLSKEEVDIVTSQLDECMNSFFNKYDVVCQGEKIDDILSNKFKELEKSLVEMRKDLLSGEKQFMKYMNNLYGAYLPKTEEMEQIDIPYEEMRQANHRSQPGASTSVSSPENDVIMVHEGPRLLPLPMVTEVARPKPKVGDRVYVMKISTYSEWVPARIEGCSQTTEGGKLKDIYRVKIETGKQTSYLKEVGASHMAYWDPPVNQLPLGTRIISLSTNSHKIPKKFFSGITAEYLSRGNKQRYLVFFDDGYCQYAHHNDVRVVCESKKDVSEYFKPSGQEFIRNYLAKFPERPMLKVNLMETIKTEFEGEWYNARVKSIDCALVQMLFLKDLRTEWIYRGSSRFFPIYAEMKLRKDPMRYRSSMLRNRPQIQYSEGVETLEEDSSDDVIVTSQPRAVARKSSSKQSFLWDRRTTRQSYLPDFGRIETIIPDGPEPKTFVRHKCGPQCIAWTAYSPEKTKGFNPLSIPHRFGFRRSVNRFQMVGDSEHDIIYKAPCGRVLSDHGAVLHYLTVTKSELSVELFDFNYWVNIFDEMVIPDRFVKIKDLSYGREIFPITCVNTVDNLVPNYMDYITERRGCEGVFLNLDSGFLTCCDCTDNCENKKKCACWQKTIQGFKALGKQNNTDPNTIGYQYRRLPELVSTGIYECNQMCKCKKTCLNRVVQHPLKLKLQLFKTKRKGWGTRCLNDIPCGTFICVYVGDILTEANANEGGKRYGDEYFAELDYIEVVESLKADYEDEVIGGIDPSEEVEVEDGDFEESRIYYGSNTAESDDEFEPDYGGTRTEIANSNSLGMQLRNRKSNKSGNKSDEASMDGFDDGNSSDSREIRTPRTFDVTIIKNTKENEKPNYPSVRSYYGKEESVYIMDAKTAGNIGRYLNHSCDPNIFVQNVFVDTHDLRFPWVAFFAMRYIKAGTELTWDYRYEVGSVPGKKMYCYCGAEECRGRLL